MYVINSSRVDGQTLWTSVTYTLTDGTTIDVDVPLFCPSSMDDVIQGVSNREITEQSKYDAEATNEDIKSQLDSQVVGATVDASSGKAVIGTMGKIK